MATWKTDHEHDGDLAIERDQRTEKPKHYKVLLHNDDYTTTDFVVDILIRYFHKAHAEAVQIMLHVHHRGIGVAGIYPRDVAETKVHEVTAEARAFGMPLMLTTEPE